MNKSEYEQRCEATEAELVRVKAQRDAAVAALKSAFDVLRREGPQGFDTAAERLSAAIAAAEKGAQSSLKASKTS